MVCNVIITLDGPAGAGKSTIAREVAKRLDMAYLDTGALYRAIAFFLHRKGVEAGEAKKISHELEHVNITLKNHRVILNGEDVSEKIRTPEVDGIVSAYAELAPVRDSLLNLQRAQAEHAALVADGRDMGTVVFPEASVKIFLSASPEIRAQRRWLEQEERGEHVPYERVLEQVIRRDEYDSGREIAPLKKAEDAVEIDSSHKTILEVVEEVLTLIRTQSMTCPEDSVRERGGCS